MEGGREFSGVIHVLYRSCVAQHVEKTARPAYGAGGIGSCTGANGQRHKAHREEASESFGRLASEQ